MNRQLSKGQKRGRRLFKALFFASALPLSSCDLNGFFPSQSKASESSSSSESSISVAIGDYDPISFHFLTLGNQYNGDAIFIKAGDNDILLDAGSRSSSATTIKKYVDKYCTDGKLEYVIATHAHQDHIAGFAFDNGLLKQYEVGTLIDFPLANSTSETYSSYLKVREEIVKNGTKHYSAKECYEETEGAARTYTLGKGLSMSVLYQKYYDELDKSNENNHSVCLLFKQGEKKMLFTGDLEDDGCDSLIENNQIGKVDLFKGGHHGSFNANGTSFLSSIAPSTICTCCVAGSNEYTLNSSHTMPYQETIDAWAKYTDDVYLTSYGEATGVVGSIKKYGDLNGNILVAYDSNGTKSVTGSHNSNKLKDTDWMKNNRTMPAEWK